MVRAGGAEPAWKVRWDLDDRLEDFSKDVMGLVPHDQAGSHPKARWPEERWEVEE